MTTLTQNPLSWFKIAPQSRREFDATKLGRQLGNLSAILAGFDPAALALSSCQGSWWRLQSDFGIAA